MDQDSNIEGTYISAAEQTQSVEEAEPEITPVMAEALGMASTMMKIIKEYNIRNISPNTLVELSNRLYDAGVISPAEYAALSFQPELHLEYQPDMDAYRLMQADPNRPRDFIAEWEKQLSIVKRHPDPFNLKLTSDILELLQSFEPMDECEEY